MCPSCPKRTPRRGVSPRAADQGRTPFSAPTQSLVPEPGTNAFPLAQVHPGGSCPLRKKSLTHVPDWSHSCCIMKYKNTAEGIYHSDKDEKEGKGCSFPSGHLSIPSLKLGQPGPCQGLYPVEDTPPSGEEKGQSHPAEPVQGSPRPSTLCPCGEAPPRAWPGATADQSWRPCSPSAPRPPALFTPLQANNQCDGTGQQGAGAPDPAL